MEFIRIYKSWKAETAELSAAEKGRLIDSLIAYLETGRENPPEGNERYIYPLLIQRIKQEQDTHNRREIKRNDRTGIQRK